MRMLGPHQPQPPTTTITNTEPLTFFEFSCLPTTPLSATITNTEPLTFFEFSCLPTTPLSATISSTPASLYTPTASPIPPVSARGQQLINELRTVNLYIALIANSGF
ncbi:hypothetical protein ABVK25_012226 [Lepraria finkii]|uniref:Uncharacterized protein n=1 Tax=Lepraria finkii TaxID=1340010 RepID=A0ABR4AK80_9LECA